MHKTMRKSFRDNMIVLSLVLAIIFAGMNVIFYLLNQSYLERKIEEENQAFLQLTTHLLNENDLSVALEYVEHYTHIHDVEIEVTDENDIMLFSSNISYRYSKEYQISTDQGNFTIFMDNTESITTLAIEQNLIWINLTLFIIYLVSLVLLYYVTKRNARFLNDDVDTIITLVQDHMTSDSKMFYEEFQEIYQNIKRAQEQIDLLQEQKDINVKSLAHDIKTPLTILYGFIATPPSEKTESQIADAMDAAKSINAFVDALMDEEFDQRQHVISLKQVIESTVSRYQDVLETKSISVILEVNEVTMLWNEQDATRILENLLSNAYQYSASNSIIKITLSQDNVIDWTVSSTPKQPISSLESLFDKGYSTSNKPQKGLGLYICKLLLVPIHGTIEAEQHKNEFRIRIQIKTS